MKINEIKPTSFKFKTKWGGAEFLATLLVDGCYNISRPGSESTCDWTTKDMQRRFDEGSWTVLSWEADTKLPEAFKFKHRDGTDYTANLEGSNYKVTWEDAEPDEFAIYSVEMMQRYLDEGVWRMIPEETETPPAAGPTATATINGKTYLANGIEEILSLLALATAYSDLEEMLKDFAT